MTPQVKKINVLGMIFYEVNIDNKKYVRRGFLSVEALTKIKLAKLKKEIA